jgi:Cu-Zn family superoxide dismutase
VRKRILIVLAAAGLAAGVAYTQQQRPEPVRVKQGRIAPLGENEERRAEAVIEGKSGSKMTGRATFVQKKNFVKMELTLENATPGLHAVHLHEKGDCSAPDAMSAGPHWNPTSMAHGEWGHEPFHHGDIGNVEVGKDGKGRTTLETDLWSIGGPPLGDILGRAIVVHAGTDDFVTQPTGNAGGRIGCGVVRDAS